MEKDDSTCRDSCQGTGEPEAAAGSPPAVVQDELMRALAGLSARLESLEARDARGWWRRLLGR